MSLLKKIWTKYFVLLLIVIVMISYGQMLQMFVYQDDNAIFFKLAHLEENAGFLGPGPFGGGAYKYTITPYIPIYFLFGYNTVAYYSFVLILYIISTISVYFIFSKIINQSAGRISGFLYASGYIASDGFIRLYNSVTTSLTIIVTSFLFLFYWKFYQTGYLRWYIFSLICFYLNLEFGISRMHYLISVIILFEIIFLTFKKPFKSILFSILRLLPFIFIFYRQFIFGADSRTNQIKELFMAFSRGEIFQSFGVVTTLVNIVFPDWLINILLNWQSQIFIIFHSNYLRVINFFVIIFIILIFLLLKKIKRKIIIPIFFLLIIFWRFAVQKIYSSSPLVLSNIPTVNEYQLTLVTLGGFLLILITAIILLIKDIEKRKLFIFFSGWIFLNIMAYSAYMPLVTYETTHRYLAHSFLPLVGLLGLIIVLVKNKFQKNILFLLIILWGIGNMIASFIFYHNIVQNRSEPSRTFYQQLKQFVPIINKGDIFYFDIAENARQNFDDALMVSQMPNTTAIAWKYGLDRYDFQEFSKFDEFMESGKLNSNYKDQVHTFFYNNRLLIDTTNQFKKVFETNNSEVIAFLEQDLPDQKGTIINFEKFYSLVTPLDLEIEMTAVPNFIVQNKSINNKIDNKNMNLIFDYQVYKNNFRNTTLISSNSQWKNEVIENLIDNDKNTFWQADRILWHNLSEATITFDFGKTESINRIAWINGFVNNIPTNFSILVSQDGNTWEQVSRTNKIEKFNTKDLQIIEFKTVTIRFLKIIITETLSKDSPSLAEIWPIPVDYTNLNIIDAEDFLKEPFKYIDNEKAYLNLLETLNNMGEIKIYWKSNKYNSWTSTEKSIIGNAIYDGNSHKYQIIIPSGGTQLSAVKFMPITIPGNLNVNKIYAKYVNLKELVDE